MFDFGFSEMLVIGVIALVVLGPERLPVVAPANGSERPSALSPR